MILEKYRVNFQVNEDRPSEEISQMKLAISEFHGFVKKGLQTMEGQKKMLKDMIKPTDERYAQSKSIIEELIKYEQNNTDFYSGQVEEEKLFAKGDMEEVKQTVENSYSLYRNPFRDAYYWLKGELLDLHGLNDALTGRDQVIKAQGNLEQKRITDMQELDKRKAGKTTLKSVFKSADSKAKDITKLEETLKTAEGEIEDYKLLVSFLTLYMHDSAIKNFKKVKQGAYMQMMNGFCVKEISNSHASASMWHNVLEKSGKATAVAE